MLHSSTDNLPFHDRVIVYEYLSNVEFKERPFRRQHSDGVMKIVYDRKTDTLTGRLKPGQIAESDEEKPGIILDFDEERDLLGFEILDASRRIEDATRVDFKVTV